MKNKVIAGYVVAVCLVVALLILLVPRMLETVNGPQETTAAQEASPEVVVEKRPDCPDVGIDLPCLGGEVTGTQDSKPVVVNVWAWWCAPCRDELPYLQEFADEHPEYHVVGVHADRAGANGAALLNELGVDLPSFQDEDGAFAARYALPGVVPITVVLRDGNLVAMFPRAFESAADIAAAVAEVV
ncbi:thiol-disulfide isomerase [Corynebacterium renale]|uniref:TlpA family protein disulfide reductase n=1 Tax=Corynebacterium renale TaxID=1724 RepID=UPI000DA41CF4|nr:TlpA disulfide reductase family protein [Corynebacterium renale]SQG63854.1 thiol-disulfide isomerase [Corynebacterium renale]STD02434.1 thiol-disulfide isomerase [Corynebacterium renale]